MSKSREERIEFDQNYCEHYAPVGAETALLRAWMRRVGAHGCRTQVRRAVHDAVHRRPQVEGRACAVPEVATPPIRATHYASNTFAFLKEGERAIHIDYNTDSAVLIFPKTNIPLPENLVPLLPIQSPVSIGEEVGWLGFPAIEPYTLCFFSGNVSARRDDRKAYLIDGVAINGVSGGPVIYNHPDGVQIVGSVNAYRANRTYGDTLPGLLIAQDVSHFHGVIQHIRSIDAQKAQEKPTPSPDDEQQSKSEAVPSAKNPKKGAKGKLNRGFRGLRRIRSSRGFRCYTQWVSGARRIGPWE